MATKSTPKEIGQKIADKSGSKTTTEIIKKIGQAPIDISKTKSPLRDSGTTLPPLVKSK